MAMKFRNKDKTLVLTNKKFDLMASYGILLSGFLTNIIGLIGALVGLASGTKSGVYNVSVTASGIILFMILLYRLYRKKIKNTEKLFMIVLAFYGYLLFPSLLLGVPNGLFINYLPIIPITCGMCYKGRSKWTIINGVINYFVFAALILYEGAKGNVPAITSVASSFTFLAGFTASYAFALIITHIIMGNLRRAYTFMENISYTDELTGLPNRRRLDEKVEQKNFKNCVMLDIDFFKKVNDTYGHTVGDEALQLLASLISKYCSDEFKCYRYGGEEFAILSRLPINFTTELVVSIVQDVRQKFCIMGEKQTISAGIGKTLEEADKELYTAKERGRNRIYYNGIQIMF